MARFAALPQVLTHFPLQYIYRAVAGVQVNPNLATWHKHVFVLPLLRLRRGAAGTILYSVDTWGFYALVARSRHRPLYSPTTNPEIGE